MKKYFAYLTPNNQLPISLGVIKSKNRNSADREIRKTYNLTKSADLVIYTEIEFNKLSRKYSEFL